MKKALTDNELENLLNFIGYGRLDADIWFLGYEELCGEENTLRERVKFQQVEDSAEAQKILGRNQQKFRQESLQDTWHAMSEILLRLDGKDSTEESIQKYQVEQLGRAEGSTLLCELLPLPMPSGSAWPYADSLPQYSSREAYYEAVKPTRFDLIEQLISQYLPKIVIAYGRSAWPDYQQVFHKFNLTPNEQFMIGWDANTVVILCDHFSSGAMDGKIEKLVTLILENSLSIDTDKPTGPIPLSKAELARQKKEAAKQISAAKRKPSAQHNPSDPYCVCAYCLGYESK